MYLLNKITIFEELLIYIIGKIIDIYHTIYICIVRMVYNRECLNDLDDGVPALGNADLAQSFCPWVLETNS